MSCYEPPPSPPRRCHPLFYAFVFAVSLAVLTGILIEIQEIVALLEPGGMATGGGLR